jgi:hypothetical protein
MSQLIAPDRPIDRPTAPQPFTRMVHLLAAALLTAAALLKAYQAAGRPQNLPLAPRVLEIAAVEFELLLAALLALRVRPSLTWGVAVATFAVFAGVSLKKALAGAPHCGCFGPVHMNPRVTTVVDAVMVALLLLAGPQIEPSDGARAMRRRVAWRLAAGAFAALMLVSFAGAAYAAWPKPGLVADAPDNYDFGTVSADRAAAGRLEHAFVVRNTASRPLRITGARNGCACTVTDLPAAPIPPGPSATVTVRADWSGVVGRPYAQVTLETDSFWTPRVPLVVQAEIVPSPAAATAPAR